MAVTEVIGKKFIQVNLGPTGGDYAMSQEYIVRAVRLTGLGSGDYMTFHEVAGSNPKIFRLDQDRPATFFQGRLMTRLGFTWSNCSVATPADAVLSIELE